MRSRSGRIVRAAGRMLLVLGVAWLAGFGWFWWMTFRPAPTPPHADGIVALTGGADRISAALRLLAAGRAPRLLISGVARGVALGDLPLRDRVDARRLRAHIVLGHRARSTRGNASEAAAWAAATGARALIVVTAGYHMPRALIEMHRTMPGVRLYPYPVHPPALTREPRLAMLRLLTDEYMKWIVARLGLSGIASRVEADARQMDGTPVAGSMTGGRG